jgi:hypothetical protein
VTIQTIAYAGPFMIQLVGGKRFFAVDGKSVDDPVGDCIVRATAGHRLALSLRASKPEALDHESLSREFPTPDWLGWCILRNRW